MLGGKPYRSVLRRVGLDNYLSFFDLAVLQRAAGAAGYLGKQLESPLAAPVIRMEKRRIGEYDSDQSHARNIKPLGDHLRAYQHVRLAFCERLQDIPVGSLPARSIGIHPEAAHARYQLFKLLLDLLSAYSAVFDIARTAGRALIGHLDRASAVVAAKSPVEFMIGHCNVAMRAGKNESARPAFAVIRVASSVEEKYRLLPFANAFDKLICKVF